jgi:hypothetical protein
VLVPVGLCDGRVGDVRLLRVVLGVAVGLGGAGHGGALVDELGVNGEVARDSLVRRHSGGWEREGGEKGGRARAAKLRSTDRSPVSTRLESEGTSPRSKRERAVGGRKSWRGWAGKSGRRKIL